MAKFDLPHGVSFVKLHERLCDKFMGCTVHNFGRPISTPGQQYPEGYNSFQTCVNCGRKRLFNSATWTSGKQVHVAAHRTAVQKGALVTS